MPAQPPPPNISQATSSDSPSQATKREGERETGGPVAINCAMVAVGRPAVAAPAVDSPESFTHPATPRRDRDPRSTRLDRGRPAGGIRARDRDGRGPPQGPPGAPVRGY